MGNTGKNMGIDKGDMIWLNGKKYDIWRADDKV